VREEREEREREREREVRRNSAYLAFKRAQFSLNLWRIRAARVNSSRRGDLHKS